MNNGHLVIIPFNIPWNWSTDYTNETAKILSKKNIVICFLWVNALSIKEYISLRKKPKLLKKHSKNLFIYEPIHIIPFRRFGFVNSLNLALNVGLIRLFVKLLELRFGKKKKILWIFHPNFFSLLKLFGQKYVTLYDCVDYFPTNSDRTITNNERDLLAQVDIVTANSKTLLHHCKQTKEVVHLVPQGFRLNHFKNPIKSNKEFCKKSPLIGYIGAINNRLNYDLLTSLAQNNPQWHFILWGPFLELTSQSPIMEKINFLLSLSNVTHGVSKNKKEVPAIINQFDIGIIPYDVSRGFNKYCYPMKLFEYFYMGKPVVSTPIEELKRFPKFVKIGRTNQKWERHIKTLLAKPWPEKYKQEQRKLAEENSWVRKIEAISKVIESEKKNRFL